ncbi:hypothetical protein CBR_g45685 [Chara braunii]|uniref:Uncharacterized protein n=1 Tax=Chara braunii TaxID=69332 RepID=A0A388K3Q1_CHABU|nr:hypothetical protein CBR_g45685 [Chara braunii]|eukprot:GBG64629.1 hypothetical protein CBR_g45685 [Chara braunii]
MGARLDKRLEKVCPQLKGNGEGETSANDELIQLKKENERLKKLLLGDGKGEEDRLMGLQREIADLRRQVAEKKSTEDDIFVLRLRVEIDTLRGQSIRAREEVEMWKGEALRPGNKRGSCAVDTPSCPARGTLKPRWTDNLRDIDKWKQEYIKMKEMHRAASSEAEVLKAKRANAEAEVIKLQEQMDKLAATGEGENAVGRGTDLKSRLEAVVTRSIRKGKKATPMRGEGGSKTDATGEANERFAFIEEQKKALRQYKKSGLGNLCKEAGLKLGMVEPMIADLAEYRANKALRADKGKEKVGQVEVVSDDSPSRNEASATDNDRSVEL